MTCLPETCVFITSTASAWIGAFVMIAAGWAVYQVAKRNP